MENPSENLPPRKLHHLLCQAVVRHLFLIFTEKGYADKVLEKAFKINPKWGARDRAFIAENTYEIVRYARFYWEILKIEPVSEADWWQILGVHLVLNHVPLPDWPEFAEVQEKDIPQLAAAFQSVRKIRQSIPDWLDGLGEQELGENWGTVLNALNQPAKVVLRTNTLKTTRLALQQQLLLLGIETENVGEQGLVLVKKANVFQTELFKKGLFELQDASSQLVAAFLRVAPGMRIVDACAGGGGKTLHLAALMENKGQIIALDTEEWKLKELSSRVRRNGVNIVETRTIASTKVVKRLRGSADRLLLDVPCSGLGVLRRNPDAKWKLSPQFIENVRVTQRDLLTRYSEMVKKGGLMVYATCSILPSENEDQVQWFLNQRTGKFRLLEERKISPTDGFDGFYMALLEKVAD